MNKLRPSRQIYLTLLVTDVASAPLSAAVFAGFAGMTFLGMLLCIAGIVTLPKSVVLWWLTDRMVGPTERLQQRAEKGQRISDHELQTADARLQAAPMVISDLVAGLGGGVLFGLAYLAHHLLVAPSELHSLTFPIVSLLLLTPATATGASTTPLLSSLIADAAGKNSLLAAQHGVSLDRQERPLAARLVMICMRLVLFPVLMMTAALLSFQDESAYTQAQKDARVLATEVRHRVESGASDALQTFKQPLDQRSTVFVVEPSGRLKHAGAEPPGWATAKFLAGANRAHFEAPDRSVAVDAVTTKDGSLAGSIVGMQPISSRLVYLLVTLFLVFLPFGPMAAWQVSRSFSEPLKRTADLALRAAEHGDLSKMGRLPVAALDEVGLVTSNLNSLMDRMRSVASAATTVGRGDLSVKIEGTGELPDAFRQMLEQLSKVVRELHATASELAAAATEILAGSEEQEAASASHSAALEEISRTMESLSSSAAHVAESVKGVFDNAERTLQNTDDMVARIDELSGRANRIGDILDAIRDIAERTDLLALNGSLEATRAGEAGLGFAIVASEMRRLAERVTAFVGDIKSLVEDIRESGASTVVATEESKKLADGTTQAARNITMVSQQQQSSTEQVANNVRSVTEVIRQSATANSQTKASAETLKEQAERINELVRRFELG